jgi:putative flavoprotein involved in K+ transport
VKRVLRAGDKGGDARAAGSSSQHDAVVIGAGQAGISLSYFLRRRGIDHIVLERDRPFSAWHNRWDGFYANTPNWMNTLPGQKRRKYPGKSRGGFATREELIDYFECYLEQVGAPVLSNQDVVEVRQEASGFWIVRTSANRVFEAQNIVVCTGAMSKARIPSFSRSISSDISQLHSQDYRRPSDVRSKHVLAVGSGSSGVQICRELLEARRFEQVHLATSDVLVLPNHLLGIQIHRFLHLLGMFDVRVHSRLGRVMYGTLERKGDPIRPPTPKELSRSHGLKLHKRLTRAEGDNFGFEDGEKLQEPDLTVIWCTGFKGDYEWINPAGSPLELDERGYPVHSRGVVDKHPGLYFVGLRYQHTVASHDIYGVGNDAEFIAEEIHKRCSHQSAGRTDVRHAIGCDLSR